MLPKQSEMTTGASATMIANKKVVLKEKRKVVEHVSINTKDRLNLEGRRAKIDYSRCNDPQSLPPEQTNILYYVNLNNTIRCIKLVLCGGDMRIIVYNKDGCCVNAGTARDHQLTTLYLCINNKVE